MTKESFVREMLSDFQAHRQRYPAMRKQDMIKFVFQGMLGAGHLLASREKVTQYIASEMENPADDSQEPLFEPLSPDWCRMNLRSASAEAFSPALIAGMMISSRPGFSFTRNDVLETCADWAQRKEIDCPGDADLNAILDEEKLPSHSSEYRLKYRPSYRVVSADWNNYIEAVRQINGKRSEKRLLVTIDGPCASGKTTLAKRLADLFEASVSHTDDFVIPHRQKTAERLAVPGGNCDAERLVREVVKPWKSGEPVQYRKYDCAQDRFLAPEPFPSSSVMILEGSCCNLPVIREFADICIFLDAPWEERRRRLEKRESPESLKRFDQKWIPLENSYFSAYHLPDRQCLCISE